MKRPSWKRGRQAGGWTLAELLVAVSAAAVGSLLVYAFLGAGSDLFARNAAVNVSHQAARTALERLSKDLHASISIPVLVNGTLQPVTDLSWAAGVSCIVPAGLPLRVSANAAAGQNMVEVTSPGGKPVVGQRLLVPSHQIEGDVTGVSQVKKDTYSLTLAAVLPVDIVVKAPGPDNNIVGQLGIPLAYVVKFADATRTTGELWYYPNINDPNTYSVVARDITSPTPFSHPIY